ncbi:hypothetical protein B1L11_12395 [Microbispora sp. GKU 823]|nr:hypothetical protein B1L11_12395 [Microbispora sp. GKU 823]
MYGRARMATRRVYAKVGPKVSALPRAAFVRARAALAWLSALVRSVPTPHRAVLGGIAVAALATAAFLLVAQPTGMLFTGGSGGQGGTRALDRPQPADSAASRSRAATGHTSRAAVGSPTPETADDPAAGGDTDEPSAGIALGMPGITGRVTPGGDRQSPREEPRAQEDTAQEDTAQEATGSLPGAGRAGEDHPAARHDGRPAISGAQGRGGGERPGAGRESGRLTGAGQDSGGQDSNGQADRRPVSEPDTTTVLAERGQGSRHTNASGGSAPERQPVRGQISRHPYQDHRPQTRAQGSAQDGAEARAQGSAQGSGQTRAQARAQGSTQESGQTRAQGGMRQAPERARDRREPQPPPSGHRSHPGCAARGRTGPPAGRGTWP